MFGSSSAHDANRTNIKLAREQRAWEEKMSNTAMARRVQDLKNAGGNPALAFTNGQSASTPSMSAPTVEPTFRPEWMKGSAGTAAMMAKQMDLIHAQTQATAATTRKTNAEAGIIESVEGPKSAEELVKLKQDNAMFETRLNDAISHAELTKTTEEVLRDKTDQAIRLIKAQAGEHELSLASAQQITNSLGVVGKDAGTVTKMILDIAKFLINKR